jgi:hypothetical protein
MQADRMVLGTVFGFAMIAAIAAPASAQEHRGTFEQQMACTPDVFRLCGDRIPDENRIVACLQQNTPQLSDACRAVFQSNNSAQQQPAPLPPPRGRIARPRPGDDDDDQ